MFPFGSMRATHSSNSLGRLLPFVLASFMRSTPTVLSSPSPALLLSVSLLHPRHTRLRGTTDSAEVVNPPPL